MSRHALVMSVLAVVTCGSFAQKPEVLMLTHSAGFTHDVVKRPAPDQPALAESQLVATTGERLRVVPTQQCDDVTAERLSKCAAVVFYTTGELPMADAGKRALIDFVWNGGGFVGIHPATDTWYQFPDYVEMIGASFNGHPWHTKVRMKVDDGTHPATRHLGDALEITDEIYQFKSWDRAAVRGLLSLDTNSIDAKLGARPDGDYASAWCRQFGKGRVFYTALGHRDDVWRDERFLKHVGGGLAWAAGLDAWVTAPPKGAVVLVDGHGHSTMVNRDGKPIAWKVVDDALEVVAGSGDALSQETFGDCRVHVEFSVPQHPDSDTGQARGNSGVYLQDRYEVQVLDSFGLVSKDNDCGAIYGKHAPRVNACLKPGEWQSYDIVFRAARWGDAEKKAANARLTVWQNGRKIHDDAEVDGPTTAGGAESSKPGPLRLQDHGNRVRYRSVWVERL